MYNISDKTNDPILRKFSDEQMDGQTEGQTDRQPRKISKDAVRLTLNVQIHVNCLRKRKYSEFDHSL